MVTMTMTGPVSRTEKREGKQIKQTSNRNIRLSSFGYSQLPREAWAHATDNQKRQVSAST